VSLASARTAPRPRVLRRQGAADLAPIPSLAVGGACVRL